MNDDNKLYPYQEDFQKILDMWEREGRPRIYFKMNPRYSKYVLQSEVMLELFENFKKINA